MGEFDWDGDGEADILSGSTLPPSSAGVPVIILGPLDVSRLVGPASDVFYATTGYWVGDGAVLSGGYEPELVMVGVLDGEAALDVYAGQAPGEHDISERLVVIENDWNGSVDDGRDWYYYLRGFRAVVNVGDLDGDGQDDLAATSVEQGQWVDEWQSGEDWDAAIFVFAGPMVAHACTADADLSLVGAGDGEVAVGPAADADADGLPELSLIVDGDYYGNGDFGGLVRHPSPVLSGSTPTLFFAIDDAQVRGVDAGGDLTGDDAADIIVGDDRGNLVAFDGRSEGVLDIADALWTVTELNRDVNFMPFANVGDVDGDAVGDVVLGFPLGMDGAMTTCGFCLMRGASLLAQ